MEIETMMTLEESLSRERERGSVSGARPLNFSRDSGSRASECVCCHVIFTDS
jgi:hypothetical protein